MRRLFFILGVLAACSSDPPPEPEAKPHLDETEQITALACPGDFGCRVAEGGLRVGVASRSITPEVGGDRDVWIAGFSLGRPATGVHDDVWARAMVFERGDLRIGLVSLDLVGYFNDDVIDVRVAASHLGFDHVLVASTHNHEGPDTMGPWGANPLVTGRDPAYMDHIVEQAVAALEEARDTARPAKLRVATATAPELIHDSREPEVIDPTITALQALDGDQPFATLIVFGNHPEALGGDNTLLTSDYPHYIREKTEAAFEGSTTVFFSGTLGGLMNPLHINGCPNEMGERTCFEGDWELAVYVGEGVADRAIAALEAAPVSPDQTLVAHREPFAVTAGNVAFLAGYFGRLFDRRLFDQSGRRIPRAVAEEYTAEEVMAGELVFQSEVNHFTIGPLELLTVPGELYPELWVTDENGASRIVVNADVDYPDAPLEPPLSTLLPAGRTSAIINQGNDALGYILPKIQYDFVEPFAYGRRQYGEVNSVGPDIAPQIVSAVQRMMGR